MSDLIERARKLVPNVAAESPGPYPAPCVCGAPRWEHGGELRSEDCPRSSGRYTEDPAYSMAVRAVEGYRASFASIVRRHFDDNAGRREVDRAAGQWAIGLSDTTSCPRAIQYRERPPDDYVPLETNKDAAMLGEILHRGAMEAMRSLYPWRIFEQPVTIPGLDRESHFDIYDPVTCVIDDIKTAGNWVWEYIGKDGPAEETWEQVMGYAYAWTLAGHPVHEVRLIYVNRGEGRDEHDRRRAGKDEIFVRTYDEKMARRAIARLLSYASVLDAGGDLPRTRMGPSTDPICRDWCPAVRHCWNLPEAEKRGYSPENYTVLIAERTMTVGEAAARYDEARTKEAEAKRGKSELAAILRDVPSGTYEDIKIGSSPNGGLVDYKARTRILERWAQTPEPLREPYSSLETPRTPKGRSLQVSRVRKAERESRPDLPPTAR
jgi:hypothetical protein